MPLVEKILTPVVVFFLAVIFVLFVKQSGFTVPLEITTTNKTTEMAVVGEGKVGGGAIEPDIEPGSQTITSTVTLYFEKK